MIVKVVLEDYDFDSLHDVILEALDYPNDEIDRGLINDIWEDIPEQIKGTAVQWGCDDTCFRDELFTWLQTSKWKD